MNISQEESSSPICLICNGKLTNRSALRIFEGDTQTCSSRPLSFIIAQVLGQDISEDTVHSPLICRKCFRSFDEIDEMESRLIEVKLDLVNSYKKSVAKHKLGENVVCIIEDANQKMEDEDVEKVEEEVLEEEQEVEEIRMPKTILNIPSSDDETEQEGDEVQTVVMKKPTLHTMEEIEMELVKMHGGIEKQEEETMGEEMEEGEQELYHFKNDDEEVEIHGHIGIDHDGEQSQDNTEALLEAAAIAEKQLGKEIKIEANIDDDRPNILKRKNINILVNNKKEPPLKKIKEEVIQEDMVSREGDLYTCLLCEGDETVCGESKAITQHIKVAHDARIYICDVCGDDFKKRTDLSLHLDEHVATEEGDFQCEVCNRIFSNLRLFRIHKRMHYPQNKAWACDRCGKKYSSKNLLEEHMNTHTGLRPYICQLCGKDFASKYTFKAHEKTHEVRPRPFQCQQCHKSFLSQQNLTQHERTHTGIKEFSCHLCDKQFGSAHNLEVHSIVHTGYKPFICGLCGKAFARKAEIRDHERTHTGERPYQCEFCGATFSQRSNLQSHKRATHYDDKRYKCDICGKGFKRRRLLDYHTKAAHTGERPFKCNVCDATFVYPEHFKKHRRIHTGDKPFLCEVCGKAFNSRDNRNAHRFVHSDKKPYECLVCGAGFMRKPLLYQHMQSQGHLNDTIVVNQPRLTTDDDQIITVNANGEMEIVEGDVSRLETIEEESNQQEDSKLYISEHAMLVDGAKVLESSEGTLILGDNGDEAEHIIIDSQQIQFAEADEADMEGEEGEHILATTEDYEGLLTEEAIANGQTQIIHTKDGPIQLVAVRIPNEKGEEEEAWIKILPNEAVDE
ncbi:PREDICTED: zinc finger protein 37-like isoform X2 [Nicrophorus vespilloides]|nr:PREDICTED: zinc finger protein 37-like isoform X2 [Nicrophorus vespilloides]XP_017770220.1 PREDICTED: zinc finger protein 37-like isoform X2 [Nicrophorus vespilloides]